MTTSKHNDVMTQIATEYIANLLGPQYTLRGVNETDIVVECDASVPDIAICNALHALASRWGYQHGECAITITALDAGFFAPAKQATLMFA